MKIYKRLVGVMACIFCMFLFLTSNVNAAGESVDVIFTHDTHSHLKSFMTSQGGEAAKVGGFPQIGYIIDQQKQKNPNTFVFDAGDFSMGTLIQTIYVSEASELRMLGALGVDVTTFGNHEFDYRSKGLASMLLRAKESEDPLPHMVISNVDWASMEKKGLSDEQKLLKEAFEKYGVKEYVIIEKGGVRIGVFGIFGIDSLSCAPTCVLEFEDASTAAKRVIKEMKEKENVDMIVCVSHSGTWDDPKKSEDEILAKKVPEIDLIISGHTHTTLDEAIVIGDTVIASCGEYGKKVGSLSMKKKDNGRWELQTYELIPIREEMESDVEIAERVEEFLDKVDAGYLYQFGFHRTQVLAENSITFGTVKDLENNHGEENLGSIIADSYVYYIENTPDYNGVPVDVTVAPAGVIRDTYAPGNITVEDVFNSFSLGIGPDEIPGYPLLDIYLTGRELKTVAEIDASVSDFMRTARLYMHGLHFTYNPNRLILNKVTDIYLVDADGNRVEIEDDKLYRVVADLYSGQMLGAVTKVSYGLLSVVPKDKDGKPIENIEDAILYSEGKEIKAWVAIATYMNSFEDTDGNGIGEVPAMYGELQGRKVIDNSKKLGDLIKNLNKYAIMIIAIVLLMVAIITFLIIFIVRTIKKKKQKKIA